MQNDKLGVDLPQKVIPWENSLATQPLGSIGFPLLFRSSLYFDFQDLALYFVDNLKNEFDLSSFFQISFELTESGIVISLESEIGPLKFLVDTGTTLNYIKPYCLKDKTLENLYFPMNQLSYAHHNFKKQSFYPIEIPAEFGKIDGVLGMRFLKDLSFAIDFKNQVFYLKKLGD